MSKFSRMKQVLSLFLGTMSFGSQGAYAKKDLKGAVISVPSKNEKREQNSKKVKSEKKLGGNSAKNKAKKGKNNVNTDKVLNIVKDAKKNGDKIKINRISSDKARVTVTDKNGNSTTYYIFGGLAITACVILASYGVYRHLEYKKAKESDEKRKLEEQYRQYLIFKLKNLVSTNKQYGGSASFGLDSSKIEGMSIDELGKKIDDVDKENESLIKSEQEKNKQKIQKEALFELVIDNLKRDLGLLVSNKAEVVKLLKFWFKLFNDSDGNIEYDREVVECRGFVDFLGGAHNAHICSEGESRSGNLRDNSGKVKVDVKYCGELNLNDNDTLSSSFDMFAKYLLCIKTFGHKLMQKEKEDRICYLCGGGYIFSDCLGEYGFGFSEEQSKQLVSLYEEYKKRFLGAKV